MEIEKRRNKDLWSRGKEKDTMFPLINYVWKMSELKVDAWIGVCTLQQDKDNHKGEHSWLE